MLKRWLCAIVLVFTLAASVVQQPAAAQLTQGSELKSASPDSVSRKECVVYVTRTGKRYHREGCSSLSRSKIPLSREAAIKRGYTPCRRCGGSKCEK